MDKYYTPEIEEFHIGFEYEVKYASTISVKGNKYGEFNPAVFTFDKQFPPYEDGIPKFRVKKLSTDCLKELGFKLTQIPGDSFDWEWYLELDGITYGTATEDDGVVDELELFGCIFHVKNKSELKVLLRQLNISIDERA